MFITLTVTWIWVAFVVFILWILSCLLLFSKINKLNQQELPPIFFPFFCVSLFHPLHKLTPFLLPRLTLLPFPLSFRVFSISLLTKLREWKDYKRVGVSGWFQKGGEFWLNGERKKWVKVLILQGFWFNEKEKCDFFF